MTPTCVAYSTAPRSPHLATVLPDGSPHTVPLWIDTRGEQVVFLTGPRSRKARNLRRDPRMALSIAPIDNPFTPVVVRGRVVEWLQGDTAWEIIDRISTKYTGGPTPDKRNASLPWSTPTARPPASAERRIHNPAAPWPAMAACREGDTLVVTSLDVDDGA